PGDGAMGPDHPISWWHAYDGGRAWYTGLGHTDSTYSEPLFLSFLLGGIRYAAGTSATPPLRIASLAVAVAVTAGRVRGTATGAGCGACSAIARLMVGGRRVSSRLRFTGGTATGVLAGLRPGRGRIFVVVTDTASGASTTASRPVHVRQ